MSHKYTDNIGILQRLFNGNLADIFTSQAYRKFLCIWFDHQYLAAQVRNIMGNFECGTFPKVVNVRFEGNAEAGNPNVTPGFSRRLGMELVNRLTDFV